jgi:hypothetical protein
MRVAMGAKVKVHLSPLADLKMSAIAKIDVSALMLRIFASRWPRVSSSDRGGSVRFHCARGHMFDLSYIRRSKRYVRSRQDGRPDSQITLSTKRDQSC